MNVLEKILKEIEKKIEFAGRLMVENPCDKLDEIANDTSEAFILAYEECCEIIRSRMDEAASKTDNDLISRKVLKEEVESLRMIITGMRNEKTLTGQALEEYKKSILKIIDEQPCCSKDTNVSVNDGWIPVSERLPEDGTYLCTLDGELCGIDEPFTGMCGIENGKWDEEGCVIAWQPLPAPYKGELNPKDPPHTCDTCRRYGKSDHNCYYCRHKERLDLWEAKEDIHE